MTTMGAQAAAVIPRWNTADRLRKVRREVAAVGQVEFAQMLGVGSQAYSAWETGRTTPRDLVSLAKRIELATGVPASWTLGLDEPGPTPGDGGSRQRGVPGTMTTCSPRNRLHVVPEPDAA